ELAVIERVAEAGVLAVVVRQPRSRDGPRVGGRADRIAQALGRIAAVAAAGDRGPTQRAVCPAVPAVRGDRADVSALGEGRHDEDVAVLVGTREVGCAVRGIAPRGAVLEEPEADVRVTVVRAPLEAEVEELRARTVGVR